MRVRTAFALSLISFPAALLLACGGGSNDTPTPTAAPSTPSGVDGAPMVNGLPACLPPGTEVAGSPFEPNANPLGGTETIGISPAAQLYVGENNMAIGIQDKATLQPIGGSQVRLTLYDLSSGTPKATCQVEAVGSAPGVGDESEHLHDGVVHVHGGEDANRAVHYAHVEFDKAGSWGLAVEAILKDGTQAYGTLLMSVGSEPLTPMPGDAAIKSDNLTIDDVDDISEIDSGDPPSDMHDVKIRDAIDAGRPLVVVFSTPAYCQTLFCGPVNQEVEELQEEYREQVDFVHIEIWRDFNARTLNPTTREWLMQPDGLVNEPVVYVIGRDGVIFDKWDGPVARNIMEASVKAVAEGAVYER
jgi:hypothetical protein